MPSNKPNISDRILAATFLKLLPKNVIPNHITIFRFIMIPIVAFFLLREQYIIGMILFAIAAFSDAVDGALARTKKKITEWGMIYDPLADKILIGLVALIIIPRFISREIVFGIVLLELVIIGASYYNKTHGRNVIKANWWGKSKMIFQSFGLIFALIYPIYPISAFLVVASVLLCVAIILAVVSVITYSL